VDESAPDIVRADDAEFEGNARLLGIADRGWYATIGHRDDEVCIDRTFLRQLDADLLSHFIDRLAATDRIGRLK